MQFIALIYDFLGLNSNKKVHFEGGEVDHYSKQSDGHAIYSDGVAVSAAVSAPSVPNDQ